MRWTGWGDIIYTRDVGLYLSVVQEFDVNPGHRFGNEPPMKHHVILRAPSVALALKSSGQAKPTVIEACLDLAASRLLRACCRAQTTRITASQARHCPVGSRAFPICQDQGPGHRLVDEQPTRRPRDAMTPPPRTARRRWRCGEGATRQQPRCACRLCIHCPGARLGRLGADPRLPYGRVFAARISQTQYQKYCAAFSPILFVAKLPESINMAPKQGRHHRRGQQVLILTGNPGRVREWTPVELSMPSHESPGTT